MVRIFCESRPWWWCILRKSPFLKPSVPIFLLSFASTVIIASLNFYSTTYISSFYYLYKWKRKVLVRFFQSNISCFCYSIFFNTWKQQFFIFKIFGNEEAKFVVADYEAFMNLFYIWDWFHQYLRTNFWLAQESISPTLYKRICANILA